MTQTAMCNICNVPLDQHQCPVRAGTVPGQILNGKIVPVRSSKPLCGRCGQHHSNEKGWQAICTIQAAYTWAGKPAPKFNARSARDIDMFSTAAQFLAHEAQQTPPVVMTPQLAVCAVCSLATAMTGSSRCQSCSNAPAVNLHQPVTGSTPVSVVPTTDDAVALADAAPVIDVKAALREMKAKQKAGVV